MYIYICISQDIFTYLYISIYVYICVYVYSYMPKYL